MRKSSLVSLVVSALGVVALVIGVVFIIMGQQKNAWITDELRAQKITLGLTADQVKAGNIVDNMSEAQAAANVLGEHLKSIAPTFGDLTAKNANGRFDPTNPTNISYITGLTLQDSMNMAVMGYGIVQVVLAVGGGLILLGLATGTAGVVLYRLSRKPSEVTVPELEYAGSAAK